jgi:prophage maintenance system killer protein
VCANRQTFIDGNKRLALVAMLTLLEIDGYRFEASDPQLAAWILGLTAGTTPE